jgi:hypothetical protein
MEALLPCCPVLGWKHCCHVVNASCHSCQLLSHVCNAAYCSLTMEPLLPCCPVLRWKHCRHVVQSYDETTVAMLSQFTVVLRLKLCCHVVHAPCHSCQLLSRLCSILQSYDGSLPGWVNAQQALLGKPPQAKDCTMVVVVSSTVACTLSQLLAVVTSLPRSKVHLTKVCRHRHLLGTITTPMNTEHHVNLVMSSIA